MRTTLSLPFRSLELWPRGRQPLAGKSRAAKRLVLRRVEEVEHALGPFLGSAFNLLSVRRFLEWDLGETCADYPDAHLGRVLSEAVAAGRVELFELSPLRVPPPVERVKPPEVESPEPTTTWFQVQFIWDDDESGAGQLSFELTTPDGESKKVTSDGQGMVRAEGVMRGNCTLVAELTEAQVSDSCRIVWKGAGVASSKEAKDAVKHLVEAAEHQVRDGETLDSVAETVGLGWRSLAKFNFGTDDADKVREELASKVGARGKGPVERTRFSDADTPGVLFVPRPFELALSTSVKHAVRVSVLVWPTPEGGVSS